MGDLNKTYTNEEGRNRRQHSQNEEERNNFGRAARVSLEDMMNLGLLSVTEGLLVRWRGEVGVVRNLEVEDGAIEALGGAERANDNRRLERLRRNEKLDGNFLLVLIN